MTQQEEKLLERVDGWIEESREAFIQDLIALVNIESVCEPGKDGCVFGEGCRKAADKAMEIAARMGLQTENDEYYCCSAILPGPRERELGIVGHLDVVPAGDFGRFEPYNAVYRGGVVIGRGASDNKGGVVTALYTAKCFHDLGIPLQHTLRVLMGCSEEIGIQGGDIAHFLEKHPAPEFSLICDSCFPFHHGEKGIMTANLMIGTGGQIESVCGGIVSNSIPDSCEAVLRLDSAAASALEKAGCTVCVLDNGRIRVSARGIAAHAAFPEGGKSAVVELAKMILTSGVLTGKDAAAMQFLADAFPDAYGTGLGIDGRDEIFDRTTCVGGMIRTEDGRLIQNINIRYGTSLTYEQMKQRISERCAQYGVQAGDFTNDPGTYIPLDDPVLQLLLGTCREMMEKPDMQPFVMGGGSHMRKLPHSLGYGCSPQNDPVPYGGAHGAEECVKIDSLLKCIRIYVIALLRLVHYFESTEA